METCGPLAPNFDWDVLAQFRASQKSISSSKILTKMGPPKYDLKMTFLLQICKYEQKLYFCREQSNARSTKGFKLRAFLCSPKAYHGTSQSLLC